VWNNGGVAGQYDAAQWTLSVELTGSFLVYVFLLGTSMLSNRVRPNLAFALMIYLLIVRHVEAACFPAGLLIASWKIRRSQRHATRLAAGHTPSSRHVFSRNLLVCAVIIASLYVGSYPYSNASEAGWSRILHGIASAVYTLDETAIRRCYKLIGSCGLICGLVQSPTFAKVFAASFAVWLGKISFCFYLVHIPLLLGIGTHVTVFFEKAVGAGPVSAWFAMLPCWLGLTTAVAVVMTRWVDQPSIRLGRMLEARWSPKDRHASHFVQESQTSAFRERSPTLTSILGAEGASEEQHLMLEINPVPPPESPRLAMGRL
jgi:peptidoglycan/LPS O-acetylase OafA/YrhL